MTVQSAPGDLPIATEGTPPATVANAGNRDSGRCDIFGLARRDRPNDLALQFRVLDVGETIEHIPRPPHPPHRPHPRQRFANCSRPPVAANRCGSRRLILTRRGRPSPQTRHHPPIHRPNPSIQLSLNPSIFHRPGPRECFANRCRLRTLVAPCDGVPSPRHITTF